MSKETNERSAVVADDLGYLLKRVSSLVTASLADLLSDEGLRVTEATVLREIQAFPNITASEVGRLLNIKRANMTPLITRMVEQGIVALSEKDGRSQGLTLTKNGEKVFIRLQALFEKHDSASFSGLATKEKEQLSTLLRKILNQ
jgi:DNA-binding MarR family transcriptional regulator